MFAFFFTLKLQWNVWMPISLTCLVFRAPRHVSGDGISGMPKRVFSIFILHTLKLKTEDEYLTLTVAHSLHFCRVGLGGLTGPTSKRYVSQRHLTYGYRRRGRSGLSYRATTGVSWRFAAIVARLWDRSTSSPAMLSSRGNDQRDSPVAAL